MTSRSLSDLPPVGVIGSGNFGTTVANLLARHRNVFLYVRDEKTIDHILQKREIRGHKLNKHITPINDLAELARQCDIIFPIVPSAHFRAMMKKLSPYLHPYHVLIHGSKGLDITLPKGQTLETVTKLSRTQVKTMSEVIREESVVVRVGCLAGPNLSKELSARQPAATVIASPFNEVISIGKRLRN